MSALDFWLTVLFGWVVISIVTGLVVGGILHRVLALPNRGPERRVEALRSGRTVGGDVSDPPPSLLPLHLPSIPTSTARSVRFSSQSISNSPKVRVLGFPQYAPIRSARSRSEGMRTWSSSAPGAGPRASSRLRSRRSS